MEVSPISLSDLDWLVATLGVRRRALEPLAPIFWHPSARAEEVHRRFMAKLLGTSGARGYRCGAGALVAAPRAGG